MTMERFWLITEPARGTSVQIVVPAGMLPNEALEHFAARDGYSIGEAYIKWRLQSEDASLSSFIADHTDDALTYHDVTRVAEIDPTWKNPGELFETWKATKTRCEDLGAHFSDEMTAGVAGFHYACGCFIEDHDGHPEATHRYRLFIERDEWLSNDYAELEARLFFLWALPECLYAGEDK